jgi:hypothetical protein
MTTKRVPIKREQRTPISARALELFARMRAAEQRCPTLASGRNDGCEACRAWFGLNDLLFEELRLKPWQFPAIRHPKAKPSPFTNLEEWRAAQARYLILAQALDAEPSLTER